MKKIFTRLLLTLVCANMLVSPVLSINIVDNAAPAATNTLPEQAEVKKAVDALKGLSKKEKKHKMKDVKKALKEYKAQKKAGAEPSTNTLLLVILAILLPPLAVYLHEGAINTKFWISLILTLLFWIPGVIYALIVVLS
jgi:uncharacterized membrane protein YqaE (UPF0057 family)